MEKEYQSLRDEFCEHQVGHDDLMLDYDRVLFIPSMNVIVAYDLPVTNSWFVIRWLGEENSPSGEDVIEWIFRFWEWVEDSIVHP